MGSGKATPSWKVKRTRSGRLDISRPANIIPSSSQSNVKNALSRILLKLRHLDLSEHVVEKSSAKDAHGGCCDVFVGHIAHEHLPPHFTARTGLGEGRVKVAIKTLRVRLNEETKIAKTLAREMAVWSKLDHPNILPFLGYMLENNYPSLISEWMDYGTLKKFLKMNPGSDIACLALGIAKGLDHMHEADFVHSDLKAANILVGPSGEPLICDFGISRILTSTESHFVSTTHNAEPRGSIRWMAIELHIPAEGSEPRHSKETDVWAFGMTLYEMLVGDVPYAHHKPDVHVFTAVTRGELPALPDTQAERNLSPFLYQILCAICKSCWARNPTDRPTMSQIVGTLSPSSINAVNQQRRNGFPGAGGSLQSGTNSTDGNLPDAPLSQSQEYASVPSGEADGPDTHRDGTMGHVEHIAMSKAFASIHRYSRAAASYDLAVYLMERFLSGSDITHLSEATELHRSVLALRPEGDANRCISLDALGRVLCLRFRVTGVDEDINESIECHRSALLLRTESLSRSWSFHELGYSLLNRFTRTKAIGDITESIESYRSALELGTVAGDPYRVNSLAGLVDSLFKRFEAFGDVKDLEEAIKLRRTIVDERQS